MKNLSNEILQKAKECKTVEELLNLAKENDFPLTEQQAAEKFNEWNKTGELADQELENVSGGAGCFAPVGENVEDLHEGDLVRFKNGYLCKNSMNCNRNDVFIMKFPAECFGELYGQCNKCGRRVKIYNYNHITRA